MSSSSNLEAHVSSDPPLYGTGEEIIFNNSTGRHHGMVVDIGGNFFFDPHMCFGPDVDFHKLRKPYCNICKELNHHRYEHKCSLCGVIGRHRAMAHNLHHLVRWTLSSEEKYKNLDFDKVLSLLEYCIANKQAYYGRFYIDYSDEFMAVVHMIKSQHLVFSSNSVKL